MMIVDLQLKHMKELVTQERAGVGWALVVDFPPSSTLGCSVFDRAEDISCMGKLKKAPQSPLLQVEYSQQHFEDGPVDSKSRVA